MASRHPGLIQADVIRIFDGRSVAGLGDGELLDRFVERRDESAFEALVTRLGPMVLGVCRRMLSDPHDVDDAFQATFLVLVRRASSIRDRDLVAPWLHGVAAKIARRARVLAIRRAVRERHEDADSPSLEASPVAEWSEVRAAIDEEIGRLPEHHRRPVVLCDVEGLTREEAAARLGWTLNMVRGRLDRARGRLRDRLTRRGMAPSGAFLALAAPPMAPRAALIAMTVRAGLGRSMGAGMVSAAVISMSEGVIRMMVFSKAKLAAVAMLSTGVMVAGAGLISAQGPGEAPKPNQVPTVTRIRTIEPDAIQPRSTAELNKARIEAAKKRFEEQATFYEEGRITIDRLIDASKGLVTAEIDAAPTKADRVTAARVHYGRVREVLKREKAELEVGRATSADVAEAETSLLDAELLLAKQIEADDPKPGLTPDVGRRSPSDDRRAKREAPRPTPSSLAVAIEAFNKKVKGPNINWTQPPLTEAEVIAAIRFWQPNRETMAIKDGLLTNITPEGTPIAAFKQIAETRELPEGASFEFNGTLDLGGANGTNDQWGDYIYHGAWVTLRLRPGPKLTYDFPICSRLDSSMTLEVAIEWEEASFDPNTSAVAARVRNLRERIKWRDREKAKTKD